MKAEGLRSFLYDMEPWTRGEPLPGPIKSMHTPNGTLVLLSQRILRGKAVAIASFPKKKFTFVTTPQALARDVALT